MFFKITCWENLLCAYYHARCDNRYKYPACRFSFFLESSLIKLRDELLDNSYYPSAYTYFVIKDPKERNVAAPSFRDRVVQHALASVIEPIFEKIFIEDTYACRKGRGTHFGAKRVKKFLMAARCIHGKDKNIYVLQCDIRKFFQSISWDTLLELISKKIKSPQTIDLLQKIVTTHTSIQKRTIKQLSLLENNNNEEVVSPSLRRGLPIGNLTSQLFANIYLNALDHFIKENLRERWYGRYMDDFLIIHEDKEHLKEIRNSINSFLKEKLKLQLHPKKVTIKNVKDGIPFVGYRIFYDHILIRGSTLLRMQRKYKLRKKQLKKGLIDEYKLNSTIKSFEGHLKKANAWKLKQKMFGT